MASIFTTMLSHFASLQSIILAILFFLFLFLYHCTKNNEFIQPLLGILPEVTLNFHSLNDKITKILRKSKGTFLLKTLFTQQEILFTCDPENVHHVMTRNYSKYWKGSEWKKRFDIFGDHGLFNSDFEEWKHQIKYARAYFGHKQFHLLTERVVPNIIEKQLIPFLEHVSKQNVAVDLQDLFSRYTFDFVSVMATGLNPKTLCVELPEVPYVIAMDNASEAIFLRHFIPESTWRLQKWLGIGKETKYSEGIKRVDEFTTKHVSIRREILKKSTKAMEEVDEEEESFNILNLELRGHEICGPTLIDEKTIKENLIGLIYAGEETTRTALTWFFWCLSKNPSVEAKIKEELRRSLAGKEFGKGRILFNLDELSKLVYLHAALSETLRLFPPVPYETRTPVEPDCLPSGHKVNPKTSIIVSSYATGRMKSIWGEDCEEFKPERWITEDGGIKHYPPHNFFAFNARPRICPGKDVGFFLMKAIVATILPNYDVQVVENHPVVQNLSIALSMKYGLLARFKSISSA